MDDVHILNLLWERSDLALPALQRRFGPRLYHTAYNILGNGFSNSYDIFSVTERFLQIKNDIGWIPISSPSVIWVAISLPTKTT